MMVVLTDGSPSSGTTYVYDGTFTGGTTEGMGVSARFFTTRGYHAYSYPLPALLR